MSEREPREAEVRELLHAVDGIVLGVDPNTLAVQYVRGPSTPLGWAENVWCSSRFWTDLMHPLEAEKTAALFVATAHDGKDRRSVHRIRTANGEERWLSTRVRAFGGAPGRPARLVVLMVDISEPLTVGKSLSARGDLERRVLAQLPAIVYTTDRDLRFTSGAGSALSKLGLRPQQLLGATLAQYYQTDDEQHPALLRHRRALAGESLNYDVEMHGVLFEIRLGPLRDESGAIIGTIGVCYDVTELRRATAERLEQERRSAEQQRVLVAALGQRAVEWEAVLKSIVDGVVVFDSHGEIRFVNESGAKATAAAGVRGRLTVQQREQLLQLRNIDGSELREPLTTRVLRGETIEASELAYTASDGTRRFARVGGAPLVVEGKRVGGVIVAHDITKVRRYSAERERLLREVTSRATGIQSILDHLVDGVLVLSRDGVVELANHEARKLLQLRADGPLTIHDLKQCVAAPEGNGGGKSPVDEAFSSALAGLVTRNRQFHTSPAVTPRRTLRMNAGPLEQDNSAVVIVIRDVSDVADFEDLKDQFIRVAAHELKTPIAVMKGYAQLLMRNRGEPPRAQLEAIDRGAQRIDRVVQELIDVSQLNLGTLSMAPAIVDLCALVTNVAEHTPHGPKHRVRIHCGERAMVRGDRYRLEFVLANLMDNAIRYSPSGGPVDVTLDVADGFATVAVRDRGVGIAPAKQPRIFERFYRAHTDTPYDYGGMGVALSLSREIVERHGGTMSFESEEGSGSTFTLRVPLGGSDG